MLPMLNVHCLCVVGCAHSRYGNVSLRKRREEFGAHRTLRSQRAAAIRSWFCSSDHRSVHLPWLSALQHCCASRCSSSDANSRRFRVWRRHCFLRERLQKWREAAETGSPSSAQVTEGELWTDSGLFFSTLLFFFLYYYYYYGETCIQWATVADEKPAAASEAAVYLPHLWCVVLSNEDARQRDTDGHGTAGGYVLRNRLGRCEKIRR